MQKWDSSSLTGLISCGNNRAVKCDLMNSEYDGLWDLAAPPLPGSHHPVSPWTIFEEINWPLFLSDSNKVHSLLSVDRSQARRQLDLTQLGATVDLQGNCVGNFPSLEQVPALPPEASLSILPGPSLEPCERGPALGTVCSNVQAQFMTSGSLLTVPLPAVRRI